MVEIKYPYVHNELLKSLAGSSVWVGDSLILSYFPHSVLPHDFFIYKDGERMKGVNGIYLIDLADGCRYTVEATKIEHYFNNTIVDKKIYEELDKLSKYIGSNSTFLQEEMKVRVTPKLTTDLSKDLSPLNIVGSANLDELLLDSVVYNDSVQGIGIDYIYKNRYSKSTRKVLHLHKIIYNYLSVSKAYMSSLNGCDIKFDNKKDHSSYKISYKHVPILDVKPYSISVKSDEDVSVIASEITNVFTEKLSSIKENAKGISIDDLYLKCSHVDTLESVLVKLFEDYSNIEDMFKDVISKYNNPL